jgi:hypothetical protein
MSVPTHESKIKPIGAWAPGNYWCNCRACGEIFLGDKRAMMCGDCAANHHIDQLLADKRELVDALNRTLEAACDDYQCSVDFHEEIAAIRDKHK